MSEPVFCDAKEVCIALGVCKSTVSKYRLRKEDPLPSYPLGGNRNVRFILSEAVEWLRRQRLQPAQPQEPQPIAQKRQHGRRLSSAKKGRALLAGCAPFVEI